MNWQVWREINLGLRDLYADLKHVTWGLGKRVGDRRKQGKGREEGVGKVSFANWLLGSAGLTPGKQPAVV